LIPNPFQQIFSKNTAILQVGALSLGQSQTTTEGENEMKRNTFGLIVFSSLISATLLFLGTTLMGRFSPALASSLNPLVARASAQTSSVFLPAEENTPEKTVPGGAGEITKVSLAVKGASPSLGSSSQPLNMSSSVKGASISSTSSGQPLNMPVASGAAPITDVTIAQILSSPDLYIHKAVTITGIATSLSNNNFLFNDGTGQIVVEVEDDLVGLVITDGMTITVTGQLDDSSNQAGLVLEASTITDQNGNVFSDDCADDDSSGDDDCSDDIDDDCSDDDCSDDDCSDDVTDDDTDDDDDDSEDDDSEDDDSGDDDSGDDDSEDDGGDD
jgi:uncharacterized protein YdeI (BOF family)